MAVHALYGLFFCRNFARKTELPAVPGLPQLQKKSDKNLRHPENLVYYIQERRKEKFPQYIRRIRRRVHSFLCFKSPLSLPAAGLLRFAAG